MSQLGYKNSSAFIVLCAGLLALLSINNTANAQLAYTSVESPSAVYNSSFSVDMDQDGINEFMINHNTEGTKKNIRIIPGNNVNDRLTGVWMGPRFPNYVHVAEEGDMIDASNNYEAGNRWLVHKSVGVWMQESDKYVGLELMIDGIVRYGWVHLTVAKGGNSFVVYDYGYNVTENGPIEAGLGATLPVELASFDARINRSEVDLVWETLSESQNAGFELQHRGNDQFETVAFVAGNGTTSLGNTYAYKVDGLEPGIHSFRLKQIDVDGNYTYSSAVEVAIDVPGQFLLGDAYPNPFNPEAKFTLAVQKTQDVSVSVYNALGQRVAELFSGRMESGIVQTFTIDGSSLSSGMYLYRVEGESFSTTKTISLMK